MPSIEAIPEANGEREVTLFDRTFNLPNAFAEGDTLTAPVAGFLNSKVAAAVVGVLSSQVRRTVDKLNDERKKAGNTTPATVEDALASLNLSSNDAIQDELDGIFDEYEVGEGRGGVGRASALERAIVALARAAVNVILKKNDRKVKDMREQMRPDGVTAYDHLVAQYVEKHRATLTPQAQAQLDAQAAALKDVSDELSELEAGTAPVESETDGDTSDAAAPVE